jgi:hypothetical protein
MRHSSSREVVINIIRSRRQHYHRHAACVVVSFHFGQRGAAVHDRHTPIEDHDVGPFAADASRATAPFSTAHTMKFFRCRV